MTVEDIASKTVSFSRHGIQHDWKHLSPGSTATLVNNKSPLDSIISQKLPKSVDVRWSYIVQHQCYFLRHRVDLYLCTRACNCVLHRIIVYSLCLQQQLLQPVSVTRWVTLPQVSSCYAGRIYKIPKATPRLLRVLTLTLHNGTALSNI